MLTAKEAKEKAIEACEKNIANEINEAIAAGKFSCILGNSVSIEVKQKLETLGYKFTSGAQYNESYTHISWRDA